MGINSKWAGVFGAPPAQRRGITIEYQAINKDDARPRKAYLPWFGDDQKGRAAFLLSILDRYSSNEGATSAADDFFNLLNSLSTEYQRQGPVEQPTAPPLMFIGNMERPTGDRPIKAGETAVFYVPENVQVFQLIDGQWQPLNKVT